MPASVIECWLDELEQKPPAERELDLRKRLNNYLDAGYGACQLRDPRVAALVERALLFFDSERYAMHAWVVMPNHVHALFTPIMAWSLSDIIGSWKSFTAKEANKVLQRTGRFWHEDFFDRFIRNAEHYALALDSIERNPVKAGLCETTEQWPFGTHN